MNKEKVCNQCGKSSEYILLDCEDGSSVAFCTWDCCIKYLCSRVTEPIGLPKLEIIDGHCSVCGKEVLDDEFCDDCLDTMFVLMTAIMKAKTIDDIAVAWLTWRNGYPPKSEAKQFLDNCRYCGKVMWVKKWERQGDKHGGQFCSRECANLYSKGA